jgi:flavin reductase (DIM6/NTAB) family NADH-FMN oxidoreductase RutF
MLTVFQQRASEKDFFRQVMGRFATGITVVTTHYQGGLWGLTVNSFCSVSLRPPLVLVCINLASRSIPLIRRSKVFAVNVLTDQQEQLSQRFATSSQERADYFDHVSYSIAVTGAPILDGVHAFVDTQVVAEYAGGDHIIFLGQVVALGIADRVAFLPEADRALSLLSEHEGGITGDDQFFLIYYGGQYHHLQRPDTLHM